MKVSGYVDGCKNLLHYFWVHGDYNLNQSNGHRNGDVETEQMSNTKSKEDGISLMD